MAGRWWPLGVAALYRLLILSFFWRAEGGFNTLANVQRLFTSDWAALAGWVPFLAFDHCVGAAIARHVMEAGLNHRWLAPLLPLILLFGPMGYLAGEAVLALGRPIRSMDLGGAR